MLVVYRPQRDICGRAAPGPPVIFSVFKIIAIDGIDFTVFCLDLCVFK
jgi:hypothetical protein